MQLIKINLMNEFNLRNITYTYHTKFDFSSFSRFSYVIIYSYMSALGYKKNTNVCFCRRWSWIHLCSHILFVVLDSSEIFHFITYTDELLALMQSTYSSMQDWMLTSE